MMMDTGCLDRYSAILREFENDHRLRECPKDWDNMVNLSSNDYLGLADETQLMQSFLERDGVRHSLTSSASRLLASCQGGYEELEAQLEALYGKSILLFNSGYHLNVGCMQALAIPGTVVVSDKLVHASIIDGIRLSKTDNLRFRHNDINHLATVIEKARREHSPERILVVTESVFSMDGDIAPLRDIVALKREHPEVMLYLDEAHAFGVRGERGLGIAEEEGFLDDIDFLAATFGKAGASQGAFIATSPIMRTYLLNTARSFIFSTSLPPLNVAWTLETVRRITGLGERRERLRELSSRFRDGLHEILQRRGMSTALQALDNSSHIVPLVIGDSSRVVELSRKLRLRGFAALPIRRPTVAAGAERIRFSLHATLTDQQIDSLLKAIDETL